MRRIKVATGLVMVLPIAVLVIGACWYLANLARAAMRRLPATISAFATEHVQGKVTIGRIDTFPSGVILRDVAIYSKDRTSSHPIVSAPSVKIYANLSDVIRGKVDTVQSINRIDIIRPDVYAERRSDGTWNFAGLIKRTQNRKPSAFHADIRISGGHVVIRDRIKSTNRPTENTISDISALIHTGNSVEWDIRGTGDSSRFGRIYSSGQYRQSDGSFSADADIDNAAVAYWSTYPFKMGLNIQSGRANVAGHIERSGDGQPLHYTADFDLNRASLRLRPINRPFTGLTGKAKLCDGAVAMKLRGNLGHSQLDIVGYIAGLHNPRIMIDASSSRADIAQITGYTKYAQHFAKIGLPHTGKVWIRIFGIPKSLAAKFDVGAPSFNYHGYNFKSVDMQGVYFAREMKIQRVQGSYCGGQIAMSGTLNLSAHPSAAFNGQVSGLELGAVPFTKKRQIAGSVGGNFEASWKPGDLDVRCIAKTDLGHVGKFDFQNGSLVARYTNGTFEVREFGARAFDGLVAASGVVTRDGNVRMKVAGSDLNAESVANDFSKNRAIGHLQFAGNIDGTMRNPIFRGEVEGYRVIVSSCGFERIAGNFTVSRNRIDVSNLLVNTLPGTVIVDGSIEAPMSKSPKLDLKLHGYDLSVENIASRLGGPAGISGTASCEAAVTGTLNNPSAVGTLKAQCALISNTPVDSLAAQFSYAGKTLKLDTLNVSSGKAVLTASGQISNDKRIDLNFGVNRFQIGRLNRFIRSYAIVHGNADISGTISGTTVKPKARVVIDCQNPVIGGERFSRFSGSISWEKGSAVAADLKLLDSKSRYSLKDATYDPSMKTARVNLSIQNGDGGKLVRTLNASPFVRNSLLAKGGAYRFLGDEQTPVACTINAGITGSIHFDHGKLQPDLRCDAALADVAYGISKVKSAQIQGSWRTGAVTLDKLQLSDGDMNLSADGSVGSDGNLALRLDAHNLSLDTLRQWVRLPDNFSGRADVTLVASGKSYAPQAKMFVEFVDPVFAGIKFDRLRSILSAGTDDGQSGVRIDEIDLVQSDHDLKASGFIPMNWHKFAVPKDRDILISTKLDSGSLDIISACTGMKFETAKGGDFGGTIKLGGTISSPELEGNIAWKNGAVQIPRVNGTLDNINAAITLKGNKLLVDSITGKSTEGGSFDVKGQLALSSVSPSVDLSVHARALELSERNLSNRYGEYVRLNANGKVSVSGDLRKPVVSGTISIPDGQLALTGKSSPGGYARLFPINPQLKLDLELGRKVEFLSSRLRSPLYGKVTVDGSLNKPVVDGSLDISNGRILFPMRQLRIMPGSSLWMHVAPPAPATLYVDMTAEGKISSTAAMTGQPRSYTVTVAAKGPIDKLDTSFSSSPPELSDQDILGLLTGKQQLETAFADRNSSDLDKVWNAAVLPTLFQTVGNVFQDALGLQEFGLEAGYNEPMVFTIGNQLFGGLYLDYSRVVSARQDYTDSMQEITLSYRFKRGLELDLSSDENMILKFGVDGKLRF